MSLQSRAHGTCGIIRSYDVFDIRWGRMIHDMESKKHDFEDDMTCSRKPMLTSWFRIDVIMFLLVLVKLRMAIFLTTQNMDELLFQGGMTLAMLLR